MSEDAEKIRTENIIADMKKRHVWPYNEDRRTEPSSDSTHIINVVDRLWSRSDRTFHRDEKKDERFG